MSAAPAPQTGSSAGALALTHSAWINAWTLARACAPLGVQLCVPEGTPGFPLPVLADTTRAQWLFFTEEASLRQAMEAGAPGGYLPRHFPMPLFDDKWAFAEFLGDEPQGPQGLAQWPLAQAERAAYPLILKARHSWRGQRRLPRGWVCRDAAELQDQLRQLDAEGLQREDYFLQEWLADQQHELLSVGGFFDADDESRNVALLTERVAVYREGPSSSAMLVTRTDEPGLVAASQAVLRRLKFRGPYEMEFIRAAGRLAVVELNPRFWMQHGLFLPLGNALVKRYLGRETAAERAPLPPQRLAWIDGTWLLRGLLRGDRRVLGACWRWVVRGGWRPVICPGPGYLLALQLRRLLGLSK
jgi:hypothetical protein